jgi:tetratricopeptide (TPR) repeat protein
MSSAPRKVALIVVHGMGKGRPHETMRKLVNGIQQLASEHGLELKVTPATPTSPMTLEISGSESRVHLYEVFCADLLEFDSFCCFDRAMLIDAAWYPLLNWLNNVEQARRHYGFFKTLAWTLVAVPLAALLWYAYEFLHFVWGFIFPSKARWVKPNASRGRHSVYNGLDDLLDRTLGNVFTYVRSAGGLFHHTEGRQLGCEKVLAAFDRQMRFASEECEEVHVLAHSLGTVVAYHGLLGFARKQEWAPRGKVDSFFTIGSPLEEFRFIWPRSVPPLQSPAAGPVSWHNYHSPFDIVSSKLRNFDQVCTVENHKAYCGGLASAHTHYEMDEAYLRAVTDVLFGIPLKPRFGFLTRLRASLHSFAESSMILMLVLLLAALGLGITLGVSWVLAAGLQGICNLFLSSELSAAISTQVFYWLFGLAVFDVVISTFTKQRRAEFEQWRNVDWLANICVQLTRSDDARVAAGAWLQKGMLERESGALNEALQSFNAAIEKSPTAIISAYAYFYRADIHWTLHSREAAFADLDAAERVGETTLTPRVILQKGLYKGITGDADAELRAFQRVVRMNNPGVSGSALLHIGDRLLKDKRPDEALAAFTRAEKLGQLVDDHYVVTSAAMQLGRMAGWAGRLEDAMKAFERAELAGGEESPRAAIELALTYEQLDRFSDACLALRRAENNGTDEQACEALMELSRLHAKAGQWDGAIDVIERAARIAEGDRKQACDAFGARIFFEADRMADAEKWAIRAASGPVARFASQGCLLLVTIYSEAGHAEKAIEAAIKAEGLEKGPGRCHAAYALGHLYGGRGERQKALDAYQRALVDASVDEAKEIRASMERLNMPAEDAPPAPMSTPAREPVSAGTASA